MTDEIERWRPVLGYEGRYEVSDIGRVRSVERKVRFGKNSWRIAPQKLIYQAVIARGNRTAKYAQVTLWVGNSAQSRKVYRLVLEAFVGRRPKGLEGCHGDGDSTNNRLDNLRWDTRKANNDDRKKHGKTVGVKNHKAKLSEENVREILRSPEGPVILASRFAVTPQLIQLIRKGKVWTHLSRN